MTTKKTVTEPSTYEVPGVRASISALLAERPSDPWKQYVHAIGREYRPLTDLQAQAICLKIHDEATPTHERDALRAQLTANCAPLAAKAAREYASQFGGDWRQSSIAALEIVQAQLPGLRESVSRKGEVTLVKTGYRADRAVVNLHGWIVTAFPTEMVKKARQARAVMNGTTGEDISTVKAIWAQALDRLGNWIVPTVTLPAKVIPTPTPGPMNSHQPFGWTALIEWDGQLDFLFNRDFTLRPITRESVSVSVYGLQAVRATLNAEIQTIRTQALTSKAAEIAKALAKGYPLDRAVSSVTSKAVERHRRILKALGETPALLTVWLSGQARPESIDATGSDDSDLSLADRLAAPETQAPTFAAAYAREDLLAARTLLGQMGNSALLAARADLRDMIRTDAQAQREKEARKDWRDLCREYHLGEKYAMDGARRLLKRVKARYADEITDAQVDAMKIVSDAWNEGVDNDDRIPWVKIAFAFRRYGRRIGDATPHWKGTLEYLHVTDAQARHLVQLADARKGPRARSATGSQVPVHVRQAYAAARKDTLSAQALTDLCTRMGLTVHAGKAIARRALSVTGLRYVPTLGDNAALSLRAVRADVLSWAASHAGQLDLTDATLSGVDIVALCRAFHAYGQAHGGQEALAALNLTERDVEASISAEANATPRPTTGIVRTRRTLQHEAERELRLMDERGARITRELIALKALATHALGDDWFLHLQDTMSARDTYRALQQAHTQFLLATEAYEAATNGGNLFVMAEAALMAEDAARDCEAIIDGDALSVAAGNARHVSERRAA